MPAWNRIAWIGIVVLALCLPATAAESDPRESLHPRNIASVHIHLNAWGPHLGFEIELRGDESGIEALLAVIREAGPGQGHKCANAGAIRFRLTDGSVVGVGLLPGHGPGLYEFRLYDGDRFVSVHRVDRPALLTALAGLGVPMSDPAFRE